MRRVRLSLSPLQQPCARGLALATQFTQGLLGGAVVVGAARVPGVGQVILTQAAVLTVVVAAQATTMARRFVFAMRACFRSVCFRSV